MKWVKCLYNGGSGDNDLTVDNGDSVDNDLTVGKIYKVIIHYPGSVWDEMVKIIKDNGISYSFYVIDTDGVWFEDADAEVRDNKINQILK